ncbi:hypothetical protein PS6_003479 [Mucor atramentarius]
MPSVGVDIVHLPRIAALIARRGSDGLAKRILSPTEYVEFTANYKDDPSQLRYLGSRQVGVLCFTEKSGTD